MDKKANQFFEIPMWLVRMFYLIVVMLAVIFVVSAFIVTEVNVQRLDSQITADFFYYSPHGFAYEDKELGYSGPGMVMPGIIDAGKFSQAQLDPTVLIAGNPEIWAAKATIDDASVYFNQDQYDVLDMLVPIAKGGPDKVINQRNIRLVDSSGVTSKTITIETVTALN